jgi:hypothetical protein
MDTPPKGAPTPTETGAERDAPDPDAGLVEDPRSLTIQTTEHWSLLSARALAYNESFTRANMFLTFVSMSFVALALHAQATGFNQAFLGSLPSRSALTSSSGT